MTPLALAGPTCCGKSELALRLAEKHKGEIISVDAGAVYRDMDIGTATPAAAMLARAPHHLINIAAPDAHYHVGRFVADARAAAADILARGRLPIIAGGTMMYFNALRSGLAAIPETPADIAAAVTAEMNARGAAAMHAELARADAESAARVAAADKQRIHRALCVYRATGKPLSEWRRQPAAVFPMRLVRLMPADKALLHRRITARLQRMWNDGLEDETRRLLQRWRLPPSAPPLRLIGYRQAAARLRGETDGGQMRRDTDAATRQLAKRQMSWLRRWRADAACDPLRADALAAAEAAWRGE